MQSNKAQVVITSSPQVHLYGTGAHRSRRRCVVPLCLIGVAKGKLAHRLVEFVLAAEIAADRPGIAGFRVGSRQNPAAGLAVDRRCIPLNPACCVFLEFRSRSKIA
jgi:hypothetical protein